ncbi:MAG: GNAT family N-acetyltransferase [Planctomycetota bacterium]
MITYRTDLDGFDWNWFRDVMMEGGWHNGRSADQYRTAYENSAVVVNAFDGERLIGTGRVLSDGVSNAYLMDLWTHPDYRRRGIGKRMVEILLEPLAGQHVYLHTDDQQSFYAGCGFKQQPDGMGMVVGTWLNA